MTPDSQSGTTAVNIPFTSWQKLILTLLCCADCMVVLDFSIVNVAVPSIQKALGFTPETIQWLFTGYGIVFGGFLLLGGKLSDLFGRKHIFLGGTALFTFASLLGGFSTTPTMLIAMRCLQGLGAALLTPAALALLMGAFDEGPQRNRALGIWGTVAAAGYSIGVVMGGILTAFFGWRWILFVNVPLGIALFFMVLRLVKEAPLPKQKIKLDILGSVLVTSGLMLLVYALVQASAAGWTSWATWRLFGTSFLLIAGFIVVEMRTEQPLMPLRIFLMPGIAVSNLLITFLSAAMVAMNLILTLYFQQILGYAPLHTGLVFLPHGIMASIAGPWGGKLANRFGPKAVLLAGTLLGTTGLGLLALIQTHDTYWFHVLPATLLISCGVMPAFVTLMILATSGAKPDEHGLVSGILNTTGQLGGAIGLAVMVAVAAGTTAHLKLAGLVNGTDAVLSGYRMALATGAAFLAISFLIGWLGLQRKSGA